MPNIVEERIKKWRDKLIDLSKRNRLLNFRPTKVTTIKITNELPSEILSILAIENEGMEFLPIESSQENLFKEEDNIERKEDSTTEFQAYKRDALDEKYRDKYLQTDLIKDRLSKNLFRIHSKANSVMEDILRITARAYCYKAEVIDISGTKYFPCVQEALSKAEKSINLVMFTIELSPYREDSKVNQLINGLIEAKQRGVDVEVILDQNVDFVHVRRGQSLKKRDSSLFIYSRKKIRGNCL